MEGWVTGAGRLGQPDGPDGGARFSAGRGAGFRDRCRRHRRRTIGEHLGRGGTARALKTGIRKHKRERRRPSAPPESTDPLSPDVMPHAFHRKRGKFKPPQHPIGLEGRCGTCPGAQFERAPSRSSHIVCPGRSLRHKPCRRIDTNVLARSLGSEYRLRPQESSACWIAGWDAAKGLRPETPATRSG